MKFIIGFLITLGLLIIVFVLILRGGGSDKSVDQTTKLLDYANTSVEMQFTIEGPVSADQTHRDIRVIVGQDESTLEVIQGYQGTVIRSKSYTNNSASYATFLRALDLAGYTNGNKDKSVADERGYCPTGYRYVMGIEDGQSEKQRLWSTSCGGAATFKGKTSLIQQLFRLQIPDYDALTSDVF